MFCFVLLSWLVIIILFIRYLMLIVRYIFKFFLLLFTVVIMVSNKRKQRRRRILDPEAGPSSAEHPMPLCSPIKKRRPSTLGLGERTILINVFKHVQSTWPKDEYRSNPKMVAKTSEMTGIGKSTIYSCLKEYRDFRTVTAKGTTKSKVSIWKKLDDFDKSAIRRKVHAFFLNGELPTLNKILQSVNEDSMLPVLSRTTLWRVLKHLKFRFMARDRKSFLIDRPEIVKWRVNYLTKIEKFRNENRRIFYLDETWVNAGHTTKKAWADTTVTSSRQAFVAGLSSGPKNPTGKGKRLIVVHIGNEEGFVEDCQWVFECAKTGDYHESMDAQHFENWFSKVVEKLHNNDVVVMDNASYHSRRQEKTPTMGWKKKDISDWLLSKNITVETTDTKVHLMAKVNLIKSDYQRYVTDEMAKNKGVEVLRLPPYHCELNPIELVWADVKGHVARNNTTFKLADVKNLLNEGLAGITVDKWRNCVEHVKKEEEKMRGMDDTIDRTVDSFIINVTEDSSEDDTIGSESSDDDIVLSSSHD